MFFWRSKVFYFVLAGIITFLIALNTGVGWLYLLSATYLSIIAVSFIVPKLWLDRLSAKRICPKETFRLNSFESVLIVKNNSRFSIGNFLVADLFLGAGNDLGTIKLGPGQSIELKYNLKPEKRGIFKEGKAIFSTGGYFGIFSRSRELRVNSEIIVLPRYIDINYLPATDNLWSDYAEKQEALQSHARGQLLKGVREYKPGDDLTAIHWRSSAKRGEIVLKEFEQEAVQEVIIVIDNIYKDGRNFSEKLDTICDVAATAANYLLNNGFSLRMFLLSSNNDYLLNPTFKECLYWLAGIVPEYRERLKLFKETGGKLTYLITADKDAGINADSLPGSPNIIRFVCKNSDIENCLKTSR